MTILSIYNMPLRFLSDLKGVCFLPSIPTAYHAYLILIKLKLKKKTHTHKKNF